MPSFADEFDALMTELESAGTLSKTGSGKFNPVIERLAAHLSIDSGDIYMSSCARPNNLNIRLTQGTTQHRHHSLAVGVMSKPGANDKTVTSGLAAGSRFIGTGPARHGAVAIALKRDKKWVIGGIVEGPDTKLADALKQDFPALIVQSAPSSTAQAAPIAAESKPASPTPASSPAVSSTLQSMVEKFCFDLQAANLIFSDDLVIRFCASLLARRFVILTGLSGSGKTKLAEAFARWLTPKPSETGVQYKIIPVGADWTSSEQVLGYPDALNPKRYETRPTLDLLLRAARKESAESPHLLILDEMNLSHVERYFSEFLSAMETGAPIDLYSGEARDATPPSFSLPVNLYVTGTVNVDETTYLFSPKVLDRANVVEFRAEEDEVFSFLESFSTIDFKLLDARGTTYAKLFLSASLQKPHLSDEDKAALGEAFRRIFRIMEVFGREFGFRTLGDVGRYVYFHRQLVGDAAWDIDDAIDAQLYQRVLPRIHGSRSQVQQLIFALGAIAKQDISDADFQKNIIEPISKGLEIPSPFDTEGNGETFSGAKYPLSAEKLFRMSRQLRDGFVSFMEA